MCLSHLAPVINAKNASKNRLKTAAGRINGPQRFIALLRGRILSKTARGFGPRTPFLARSRSGGHHCFGSDGMASEARSGTEVVSTGTAPRSSEAAAQSPALNLAP